MSGVDERLINLILQVGVVVFVLAVAMVRWVLHRRALERGEKVEGPPPPEPRLPYEDVVDEVFGPYIRRRRRQHEERTSSGAGPLEVEVIEVIDEPEPAPPPVPVERPTPPPPPPAPVVKPPPAPVVQPVAAAVQEPGRPSLEEALLRNPRWGFGARLVVAGEILGPPKALRGRDALRRA